MAIPGRRSRLSRLIGAGVMFTAAVAIATPAALSSAEPAFAAVNVCQDSTTAQPTAVHQLPSASSPTVQFLNVNAPVNEGYCEYFNNLHEGHWYMTVRTTNGSNGGVGFIWVQRLHWGSQHLCAQLGEPVAFSPIGDASCPLYNYYGN